MTHTLPTAQSILADTCSSSSTNGNNPPADAQATTDTQQAALRGGFIEYQSKSVDPAKKSGRCFAEPLI